MIATQSVVPCLWFDTQAEEAARFYTGVFKSSRIGTITRYSEAGHEVHGRAGRGGLLLEEALGRWRPQRTAVRLA